MENGEQPGYPRFQGKNRFNSFTYKQFGNGATLRDGSLVLSKIGRIAIKWSRGLQGTIKTVTITHDADGWYVCFSCADVPTQPLPPTGRETGIDVGLKVFLITADGDRIENPRHYRRAERALKKAQRQVARRKKGSKRRREAAQLLAKKHQTIRRQRTDFHHKTALALVREYDTIYLEDLPVANLNRRPAPKPDGNGGYLPNGASAKAGLNKSINDAGWAQFRTILSGKAAYAGRRVVAVPPAYTSQDCSGCGERVDPCLSLLWTRLRSRRERGEKHSMGWAGPSGTRGRSRGVELRSIPRLQAGECQ